MLRKITPPLKLNDTGDAIVNLQDALSLLIDKERLKIDDQEVREKLLRALAGERERQIFGDNGTFPLVKIFQTQQHLEPFGQVDAVTADALNKLLLELGELDDPSQPQFLVQGQVQYADGRLAAGVLVRAFDKDLRSEEFLGDDTTDEHALYLIKYTADKFLRAENGNADLRIAVYEPGGRELVTSDIQFNAAPEITINLTLPSAERAPSEYERYLAALRPLLQGLYLRDLREDDKYQDITFLAGDTGIARERIAWLVQSAKLTAQTERFDLRMRERVSISGIPSEAFYGLLRQGLPQSLEELATLDDQALRDAFDKSVRDQIIPALGSDVVEAVLARMHDIAVGSALRPAGDRATASLGDLLTPILPADKQVAMTSAYLRRVGDIYEARRAAEDPSSVAIVENGAALESLWSDLADDGFSADDIRRTQHAFALDRLTTSHVPLIHELMREAELDRSLGDPAALARFDEEDWVEILKRPRNPDDPSGPSIGAPAGYESIHSYAGALADLVQTAFPTRALAERIARDDDRAGPFQVVKADLATFFARNTDFALGVHPVDNYLGANADEKLRGVIRAGETRAMLKRMERVAKFAPRFDAMRAMLTHKVDSSYAALKMGRSAFRDRFKDTLGGDGAAGDAYDKASDVALRTLSLHLKFGFLANSPSPYVLKASDDNIVDVSLLSTAEQATWRTMFGSLESCACEHCQSLNSPAAYLVDLLVFLRQHTSDDGRKPLDVLLERRPDLAQLELTCDNTNLQLPYVDLANEILERAVAGPLEIIADLTPADLDAGVLISEIKDGLALTAKAELATERAGQAWTISDVGSRYTLEMNERRNGVLVRSFPQTVGPQAELAANPQHTHAPAYEMLAKAVYPWSLPFHLPVEQARSYLHQLGVERHQAMAALAPPDELLSDAAIAIELLGLTSTEAGIIDPAIGNVPSNSPWTFWGFEQQYIFVPARGDESPAMTVAWDVLLKRVGTLLAQSGMKYVDLLGVLTTYFVNPKSGSGRALSVTSTDSADPATCDPNKLQIPELDAAALQRMHRFVRLQRKLGWTARDLDRAMTALGATDLTTAFLKQLANVRRLQELLRCPLLDLLAFWSDIDAAEYSNVVATGGAPARLPSKYDELFRNKSVANPLDAAFTENPAGLAGALADHMPTILSALRISAAEFTMLTTGPSAVVPNGNLNLANLSALFRYASLARRLRLSIADLLRAKVLIEIDPFASTEMSVRFVESVNRIRASGFDVRILAYLLRHDIPDALTQTSEDEQIAAILAQLRDGLRKIDQETTAGDDPDGGVTRSKLTLLKWNEAHIDQATALLGDGVVYSASLVELPSGIEFPPKYASRVSYNSDSQKLEVRGVLSVTDRRNLLDLQVDPNADPGPYQDAVEEVFEASREAAKKFIVERMRAFELPAFAAPTGADRVRLDFELPERWKNRIAYDADAGRIVAGIPLSDADEEDLLKLSQDSKYQGAVRELAALPLTFSPTALNRFLIFVSNTDPATDPARTSFYDLFDSEMSIADRFDYVLTRICAYLRRALSESFVKQSLSDALRLDAAAVDALLTKLLVAPSDGAGKAIEDLLAPEVVGNGGKFSPARYAPQFELLARLRKVATLVSRLKITAEQLTDISRLSAAAGWLDWNALPASAGATAVHFVVFDKLVKALELRGAPLGGDEAFRLLRLANSTTGSKRSFIDELAEASEWSVTEIEALAGTDAANDTGLLDLHFPSDFLDGDGVARLRDCFRLLNRLGAAASQFAEWAEPDLATPDPAATKWSRAVKNAVALRNVVKAKYGEDDWLEVARPLTDQLRDRQRAALVAFLVARGDYGREEADLYDHFLIDVEMCACMTTTRLKQTLCSIQLFVQRCLMNLESEVRLTPEQAEQWNTWRKLYRVWEANRKVLLYPENWIEPELRDDKSPFFKEAESELLQNDVTSDSALQVLRGYLERLHQVARLEIVGLCLQQGDGATANVLHVFGRTYAIPHKYFYRRLRDGVWSPWEKIDVDIEGDHLIPAIWNNHLYLFWPIFTEKSEPATKKQRETNEDADKYLEIKLAWTELKQGKWMPRKLSRDHFHYKKDSSGIFSQGPETFKFLSRIETGGFGSRLVIDCYGTFISYADQQQPTPPPNRPDYKVYTGGSFEWVTISCTLEGQPISEEDARSIDIIARKNQDNSYLFTRHPLVINMYDYTTDYYISQQKFTVNKITHLFSLPLTKNIVVDLLPYAASPGVQTVSIPVESHHVVLKRFEFDDCNGDFRITDFPINENPHLLLEPLTGQTHYEYMMIVENENRDWPFGARNVMLGQTPGAFRALMRPNSYVDKGLSVPFAYQDQQRAYLVDMVSAPDGFWDNHKLRFEPFYHAWTCRFIEKLEAEGLAGFLSLENQTRPDQLPSLFEDLYDPKERLIDLDIPGDPTRRTPRQDVDFSPGGAYSLHNWELFYHFPLLIATQLSKNQRFEEARRWFHFIFDPTSSVSGGRERFWRFKPFFEEASRAPQTINDLIREESEALDRQIAAWKAHPFQPFVIARQRVTAFMRNVVMLYLDNLIAWGDQLLRRDTIESINEATQLYVLAARILGKRPESVPPRARPKAQTFATLELDDSSAFLDALVEIESYVFPAAAPAGSSLSGAVGSLGTMPLFCIPPNDKLLGYWDTVEDRLFKIRHCMNIEGIVRELPIFEPPIDPALLVRATALGVDLESVLNDLYAPAPQYRFTVMKQKAGELCAEVRSLGAALLAALEKRDAEELALLRSRHELETLGAVRRVKEQQVQEARSAIEGLQEYQKVVTARQQYYLNRPFLNQFETAHLIMANLSLIPMGMQIAADFTAGILNLIPDTKAGAPTTMGLTYGGSNIGAGIQAFGGAMGATASMFNSIGSMSATMGGYQRRQDDWTHQADLATKELEQVSRQIAAAQIRMEIAERELENHDLQAEQSRETDAYLREKYTSSELYNWMTGQIAALYFQSYRLAYDFAKRAEQAYRQETGASDSNFIQFGYWDSLKKGLLAGERLQLDLARMETDYFERNKREYEITKHISLLSLDPIALIKLRQTGRYEVAIPEEVFDLDYPGHYLRRIKSVSLTIPCVTGPYTGVNCTLTLLKSSVRHRPGAAEGYARNDDSDSDSRFRDSFGAIQSVVTSSGQNDSGLFETNLRDERYLPFEGSGAISSWRLEMPSEIRQFDYDTISDVILHIRYTAREGGQALKDKAVANLKAQIADATAAGMVRLFSVRREFPSDWARFKNVKLTDDVQTAELSLPLREEHYPYWSKGRVRSVIKVEALAKVIDDTTEISVTSAAARPGADDTNGDGEGDKLKASPIQGLLQGNLSQSKPAAPFSTSDPPDPIRLYFNNNKSIEDLWLAVTWGE
jgi:Tc toxin complex TcA C-terminal TcB-binding domain/ABC toxin N-terminal region/Neuraminidase-like domain/Salmonella virulence plasmid 28.1kDa A protein